MKTELELKHIIGYIPYKLNAKMLDYKTDFVNLHIDRIVGCHQWDSKNKYWCLLTLGGSKPSIERIKPYLKPLTDLLDDGLEDNFNYELSIELAELLDTNFCEHFVRALIEKTYYVVDSRKWEQIEEFLNKFHFDWKYDLIEKGLAISTSTINIKRLK